MKKALVLLLTALCCLGMLTACGSSDKEDTAAKDDGTVVFKHGFDLDYPPYSYLDDNGDVGGFDVELCQAVCDYLGWEYEAVPLNWDSKDAELESGSCDCIWSGFTINGREDDYCWSIPYSDNTQKILVLKDSGIKTIADLKDKNVGVQAATSALDLLEDEEGAKDVADTFKELRQYDTYTTAYNDLKAGAIEAIAIDVTTGQYFLAKDDTCEFIEENLGSEQYGIGFRLDDEKLRDQVNEALNALVENGTYDKIGQKYPEIYDYLCLGK